MFDNDNGKQWLTMKCDKVKLSTKPSVIITSLGYWLSTLPHVILIYKVNDRVLYPDIILSLFS